MDSNHYDIAVLGGGPVGLLLTALLIKEGFSVACFERAAADIYAQEKDRCLALSWGSLTLLDQLGLKDSLITQGAAIHDIWTTQEGERSFLHYDSKDWGHPMGVNVAAHYLKKILYDKVQSCVHLATPVTHISQDQGGWYLEASDKTFKARLVIGADGYRSWLRNFLKFKVRQWDYPQRSLVAIIHHSQPHHHQAYEHFLTQGPLAFLPMTEQCSSLIWTVSPGQADALMHSTVKDFLSLLQQSFGTALGKLSLENQLPSTLIKETGRVESYPLGGLYCPKPFQEGTILVGDAAHTMHPVAGQGFNIGLRDAFELTTCLKESRALGLPWWSELTLKAYYGSRKKDILLMLGVTHGLTNLFSKDIPLLKTFLAWGLGTVNRLPPLKRFLTQKAMGLPFSG